MAKVKVPRNDGSKIQKVSNKLNNATPRKVSKKGKIQKKLSDNTKGEENNAYINKYLEIQSQTRLCFVNIKRLNNVKTSDTLQAQCTDAINNNIQNISSIEHEIDSEDNGTTLRQKANVDLSSATIQEKISCLKSSKKNSKISVHTSQNHFKVYIECEPEARGKLKYVEGGNIKTKPEVTKKCIVKLHKLPMVQKSTRKEEITTIGTLNGRNGSFTFSEITNPTLNREKRDAFGKLSLSKPKLTLSSTNKTTADKYEEKTPVHDDKLSKNTNNKFVPEQNTTVHLEPLSNSNVVECNSSETQYNNLLENVAAKRTYLEDKPHKLILNPSKNTDKELPLIRKSRATNKNVVNLEKIHFEPVQNSTALFDPVRNSTAAECNSSETQCKNLPEKVAAKRTNDVEDNPHKPISNPSKNTDKKLPLTGKTRGTNKNIVNLEKIHFVPEQNSTVHFEHIRNTTFVECNLGETNDYNMMENGACQRRHKFFHRKDIEDTGATQRALVKENAISKKYRLLSKRSSQVRREKVYDFLSQSQTSESEGHCGKSGKSADPTADIIKKLIAQGKVAVATNYKGKGRPKLKRNVNKKTNRARKQTAAKRNDKYNERKKKAAIQTGNILDDLIPHTDNEQIVNQEDYDQFDHFLDDADDQADKDFNINKREGPIEPIRKALQNQNMDQEGTFSNLAKSVLISQARLTDPKRLKAQRLLSMAKKLISTPNNNKVPSPQTALNADFSPIIKSNTRPATMPSPWRVNEDANFPRVFNFSRSSGNLPSFSSDFIPPTPRKKKTTNKSLYRLNEISENRPQQHEMSPLPIIESISEDSRRESTPLRASPHFSAPSSFSSNDSNSENKSPPKPGGKESTDKNTNIFDLKQLPNPRKALSYRSPLKPINILEVVHLPPIQNLKSIASKEKTQLEMFGFEDMSENDTFITPSKPSNNQKGKRNSPDKNLYGFEEFLSQNEMSSQETDEPVSPKEQINNSLNWKLHSLRKLRPNSCELEIDLQHANKTKNVPKLFNEPGFVPKPQKTIKEMLCSNILQQPSTSKKCLQELYIRNAREQSAFNSMAEENVSTNISELFKDPEITFREEDPHRTYVQPYKRKRRLRDNKLVFEFESDASEDEHNHSSSPQKKTRAHHQCHKTDTCSEQPNKKKRKVKEKPELKHFVEEFNEMCKEVESYELIVEKSS